MMNDSRQHPVFEDPTQEELEAIDGGGIVSWLVDLFRGTSLDGQFNDETSIPTTRHVERLAGVTGSMCGGNGNCL